MQVVSSDLVKGKKVLLRLDLDVPLENGQITEDFRLKAGLPTIKLCLESAGKVVLMGHLGRPFKSALDEQQGLPTQLSLGPVHQWLKQALGQEIEFVRSLEAASSSANKAVLLENLRFFHGEVPGAEYHTSCSSKSCDIDFAKKLAGMGNFFVNEAFAAHHPAASATMLPTLLPHAAGLRFAEEVKVLTEVRENPPKPFVAVIGGAKVEDKLPVIKVLAQKADAVLVGGKLVQELKTESISLPSNVLIAKMAEDGLDIAPETTESWRNLIMGAKTIVWNGPLGKFEDPKNDQTKKVAQIITESSAKTIIGGGDTISALSQAGLLEKLTFASTGGGAMLKFLTDGTLPTIQALGD